MNRLKTSLIWYAFKRILQGIPLVLVVVLFCFAIIQLAPGDPIAMLGGSEGLTEEQYQYYAEQWGTNQPLGKQCLQYCKNMLSLNLGDSYRQGRPVTEIILERLPATMLLLLPALGIACILGIAVGMYCARHMYTLGDNIFSVLALSGYSVPLFWIGQMLILLFSMKLGILPVSGIRDLRNNATGLAMVWDVFKHLILPGSCLVFYYAAMILRVMRTKMAEVLKADYIKTARAKGVPERRVLWKHALKNALGPVITVVGMEFGSIVMGATVVETVFAYPGTGRLIFDAVAKRDYPLISGMFFFIAVMVILANIVVDILYAVIDPQVRYD